MTLTKATETPEKPEPPRAAATVEVDHPTLGAAVAILDDRRKSGRKLLTSLGLAVIGAAGVALGLGDMSNGDGTGGSIFLLAGVALLIYGASEARATFMRLRTRFSLVVGELGFEYAFGVGSVTWDEVASLDLERVWRGTPGAVRVRVKGPDEFAARHELSLASSLMLRINDGALYVGRGALMPAAAVLDLMNERLAEFRATRRPAAVPAQRARRRTSRH